MKLYEALTHSYYYLNTSDIVSLYRQTHVTERQARDSLLQLAGQRFCWGKKAAQDMVISSITSSSAFHVSIMWCWVFFVKGLHKNIAQITNYYIVRNTSLVAFCFTINAHLVIHFHISTLIVVSAGDLH